MRLSSGAQSLSIVHTPRRPCTVFLLQVAWTGVTPKLRALLEDGSVLKAGVAASGDAMKLWRDYGVACGGIIDLCQLAQSRLETGSRWSLAGLVERVMGQVLPKPPALRISAWDARVLSREQTAYAALDAFASLVLYHRISSLPQLPPPLPPPPLPSGCLAVGGRAPQWVEAAPPLSVLSHSKAAVHQLHVAGVCIADIAEARSIKPVTVTNYLAEAIVGGHAYLWHLCEVPPGVDALVDAAILAEAAQPAEPPAEQPAAAGDSDAVLRGHMKALKARLPEEVTFGQLRREWLRALLTLSTSY